MSGSVLQSISRQAEFQFLDKAGLRVSIHDPPKNNLESDMLTFSYLVPVHQALVADG